MNPVRNPDGTIENFTLKVAGQRFRCVCGCNVFHKPDETEPEIYECNGCGREYESE